jgi:hypothetical protein
VEDSGFGGPSGKDLTVILPDCKGKLRAGDLRTVINYGPESVTIIRQAYLWKKWQNIKHGGYDFMVIPNETFSEIAERFFICRWKKSWKSSDPGGSKLQMIRKSIKRILKL